MSFTGIDPMIRTALIFPGQGSQLVGMGKDFAEVNDHAATVFRLANEVVGFDLAGICFSGPPEQLEATDIQQPAILVTSIAIWAALSAGGRDELPFHCAAGLSLGEYTALHLAGVLDFEDAVQLVYRRGRYMQEACESSPGGMVSILGMEADDVQELCGRAAEGEILEPANFNCPGQVVLSGTRAACDRAVRLVESAGRGKAIPLKVAGAFHSALMKPAADRLDRDLQRTVFKPPRVPVISNVDAQAHARPEEIRTLLHRQVFSPVRWEDCVRRMIDEGTQRFIELGPGRVLTGLMRKIDRSKAAVNISTAESLNAFTAEEQAGSRTSCC